MYYLLFISICKWLLNNFKMKKPKTSYATSVFWKSWPIFPKTQTTNRKY